MATSPVFYVTPTISAAAISTANTNRDGTGTIGTVITGAATGTKIDRVVIHATVTTTAGMVRLYLHDGSTARLLDEVVVAAITVAAGTEGFHAELVYSDLVLPSTSWSIRASTHNAESFNVFAFGRVA